MTTSDPNVSHMSRADLVAELERRRRDDDRLMETIREAVATHLRGWFSTGTAMAITTTIVGRVAEVLERPSESSPDLVGDVDEFHRKFDQFYEGLPRTLPEELRDFRAKFLEEEVAEYRKALAGIDEVLVAPRVHASATLIRGALADQLDALVDLVYVALGNAVMHGFDFREAWRRVHAANMAKVRAADDGSDSKRGSRHDVVKPPGWRAPDHSDLVADNAHTGSSK